MEEALIYSRERSVKERAVLLEVRQVKRGIILYKLL